MSTITTYTRKHFDPVHPDPGLLCVEDFAHALPMICRGNGHVTTFWSVGEHCICCAKEAAARGYSRRLVLACLLHDASECYMSDVPRPLKQEMPRYREIEDHLLSVIYEKYLGSDLTAEEQRRRGRELTADEWLAIAEEARSRGMLFLLLTGGEPLIRADFRYLLTELKKMGLLVSVNSNGSLIDRDWLEFFRHEPPFRFNITLYGGSDATYERLCGRAMFGRVTENIRALRELGIGVKLNASMTPYNIGDMEQIYHIAEELGTPMQLATYMFPPIRRDESAVGHNDRFTACEAADYSVRWDRLRLTPEQFQERARAMKQGLALPSEEESCEGTPGEGVSCRAGRSAFWINWQGGMTPCGMMTQPLVSVPELGFARAWEETKAATARIRLPGVCAGCRLKNACHACAAMCVTETGRFDARPDYVCEMTHETVRRTIEEVENEHS